MLTDELHRAIQPRQDLLTERIVDGDSEEVGVWDEVWFGAGIAGVQDVGNVVLLYQVLENKQVWIRAGPERLDPKKREFKKIKYIFF